MADASALGIHPPSTVRIDMGGWVQDWPWESIRVLGDRVEVVLAACRVLPETVHKSACRLYEQGEQVAIFYPYEHARKLIRGNWIFHGREDFTVTAGPPQPPSVN